MPATAARPALALEAIETVVHAAMRPVVAALAAFMSAFVTAASGLTAAATTPARPVHMSMSIHLNFSLTLDFDSAKIYLYSEVSRYILVLSL